MRNSPQFAIFTRLKESGSSPDVPGVMRPHHRCMPAGIAPERESFVERGTA
jgi:hypothetical protein